MEEGKRTKEELGARITGSRLFTGEFKFGPKPNYIPHRLALIKDAIEEQAKAYDAAEKRDITITVHGSWGEKDIRGKAYDSTPMFAIKKANKKVAKKAVVARVVYSKRDAFPLTICKSFLPRR